MFDNVVNLIKDIISEVGVNDLNFKMGNHGLIVGSQYVNILLAYRKYKPTEVFLTFHPSLRTISIADPNFKKVIKDYFSRCIILY